MISQCELKVLTFMCSRREQSGLSELAEISANTGIRDSDEVLRALYTLEGKQLVRPQPAGNFTSSTWLVTEHGIRALRLLGDAAVESASNA